MKKDFEKVPVLRFSEFFGAWQKNKFGSFSTVIRGASPRPKGDPRYYGGGVPRLMVQDVARDGKYANPITDSLTHEGAKLSRFCPRGTLTVVCSGTSKTVGQASFLNDDACIHDGFLALTGINKSIAPEFVYYQILRLQEQSERMATHGGTFINLTTSILKEFVRYFPPLTEQQKIASFLSAVDKKMQQLSRKKELLEQYKKGVMQKIFSKQIRFKEGNGQDYPAWQEKRLAEIASFSKGKGISKEDVATSGGKLECIRYGELYTVYSEIISHILSKTNIESSELVLSRKNDVIIPSSGETHIDLATASCVPKDGVALGGDINIIRTQQNGVFLAYYLNNAQKHEIAKLAQGNSVVHLYSTHLKNLKITLPTIPEQHKIAAFLSNIDKKIAAIQAKLTQTQTFKKGLLQQMFV